MLLDPTASIPDRFLDDTPLAKARRSAELAFNDVWLRLIGLFTGSHLVRTRVGRAMVRLSVAKDLSDNQLAQIYRYTDSHPRAILETGQMLHLLVPYFLETTAAVESATLPDVPVRIIRPQPRPRWQQTAGAQQDAALHTLVARFPQGRLVPALSATHQWLPFERPEIVIDAVRDVLSLGG